MADGQVVGDPARIRKFAAAFENFRRHSDETYDDIKGQLARLSETWCDETFDHFSAQVIASENQLLQMMAEANRLIPKLLDRAERIDAARAVGIDVPR